MRWKIALVAKNRAVGWNHNPEDNFPAWAFRLRAGVAISVGGFSKFWVLFWHKKNRHVPNSSGRFTPDEVGGDLREAPD